MTVWDWTGIAIGGYVAGVVIFVWGLYKLNGRRGR